MGHMDSARLDKQIQFILEVDRLKHVLRQTLLADASRQENSAEHSWHMAVMAILLAEYANQPIDLPRVLQMILVHDIVEIDAGDTYCYDAAASAGKARREQRAAQRIFALLPLDQADELRALWEEFEERRTAESRFANALDRTQPVLLNYYTQGRAWRSHGVKLAQVMERNSPIEEGSARLWQHVRGLIDDAVNRGYLSR